MVEDSSTDENWEEFQGKLLNAKSSHKGKEGKGPRYAVYDFQYELEEGEGTRYVLVRTLDLRFGITNSSIGTRLFSFHGLQMKAR